MPDRRGKVLVFTGTALEQKRSRTRELANPSAAGMIRVRWLSSAAADEHSDWTAPVWEDGGTGAALPVATVNAASTDGGGYVLMRQIAPRSPTGTVPISVTVVRPNLALANPGAPGRTANAAAEGRLLVPFERWGVRTRVRARPDMEVPPGGLVDENYTVESLPWEARPLEVFERANLFDWASIEISFRVEDPGADWSPPVYATLGGAA